MKSIMIEGSASIDALTMEESSGDSIRYAFDNLENRELTDEESRIYAL